MAEIIKLDTSRKPAAPAKKSQPSCAHKSVTVYAAYRTVRCSYCGALLDPFVVLLDMVKGYLRPPPGKNEEKRFLKEVKRRTAEKETTDEGPDEK